MTDTIKQFISTRNQGSSVRAVKNFLKNSTVQKIALLAIPLLVIILIIGSIVKLLSSTQPTSPTTATGTQIAKPLATMQVNKEFTFSLKDNTGKVVGNFKYKVVSVEEDKQIIIKGQRATAVDGRVFLIVNLQLTNSGTQGIQVNTRDYMRLSSSKTDQPFAPEIHNDPVEVQAISTEFSRVGFPIDEISKNLVLNVGEITGIKKSIKLILK